MSIIQITALMSAFVHKVCVYLVVCTTLSMYALLLCVFWCGIIERTIVYMLFADIGYRVVYYIMMYMYIIILYYMYT